MRYIMENSRTQINSSEEAALDHLERHLDTVGDDEHLSREDAVAYRAVIEIGSPSRPA